MARLTINIPEADLMELLELGRRCNASQSQLGTLAIKQLLINSRDALPLLPPVRLDKIPCAPWEGRISGGL